MTDYTVTTTATVNGQGLYDLILGAGVSYWANVERFELDSDLIVVEHGGFDDPAHPAKRHTVPWQKVADAVALMATGSYTKFDGSTGKLNAYHTRAAVDLLYRPDDADCDADTGDLALQLATLGRELYA